MDNLTPITREEMLMNDEPLTPITREEKILAGEDLNPVTRREYFLKKYRHAGGDVMVEGLEVTANGTYTAPEGKAYSPVEVAVPLPDNAYLLKEASGSLVSFSDGADLPMPSFICNIDAVQDLHGYDAPWVGGAGKNKLPMTVDGIKKANGGANTWNGNSKVINDITFTILSDNEGEIIGVNANGTATADAVVTILVDTSNVYGDLYFVGCNGGSNNTYNALMWDATTNARAKKWDGTTASANSIDGTFQQVKIVQGNNVKFQLRVMNGQTVNNVIFQPMICLSTETDPTFAPYSNICPISGHTGLNAWVRGKNQLPMTVDGIKAANTNGTWSENRYTYNGVTFDVLTDSDDNVVGIKANGQASANAYFDLGIYKYMANTSIVLNGCPSGGGGSTYRQYPKGKGSGWYDQGSGVTFPTVGTDESLTIRMMIYSGYTASNLTFYPMIRLATETDSTFAPYNPNSQTIQVSWQTEAGEVFGGYVDLVSGELTATHKSQTGFTRGSQDSSNKLYNIGTISDIKAYTNVSAISPYFVDSMFEKMSIAGARAAETPSIAHYNRALYVGGYIGKEAELDTLLGTLQVKYELATPITYQLTPQQIKSLLGNNNAWCSTGDVDIDYFAKEVTG